MPAHFYTSRTYTGPHDWQPPQRSWRDRLFRRAAYHCTACYHSASVHPIDGWTVARPLGDDSPPRPGLAVYDRDSDGLRERYTLRT